MSVISITWLLIGGVYLGVAAQFFVVWLRTRTVYMGIFALSAASGAALMLFELALMRAGTPAESGEAFRWVQLAVVCAVVGMVWFVRFYLQAGKLWLAWLETGLRVVAMTINFLPQRPNFVFVEMLPPREVHFLGETVFSPLGVRSNWELLTGFAGLVLIAFLASAVVDTWNRKDRRNVFVIAGAYVAAVIITFAQARLVAWGLLDAPYIVGINFGIVIIAIFYLLSDEIVRAGQLAERLTASEQSMKLATTATGAVLWEWDLVRDRIWISDVGQRRLGINPNDTLSFEDSVATLIEEDRAVLKDAVRNAIEGDGSLEATFRINQAGEEDAWVSTTGKVEYDPKGRPHIIRGISLDITEQKRAADDARSLSSEIAHLQRAYTVGNMSSALAHELNQPLGAILRNAEAGDLILKQSPPDLDELEAIFSDIRYDQQRAIGVIDHLRGLLKRRDRTFESVDVAKGVADIVALLRSESQREHISIETRIPANLPPVLGDRVQLQQVILNLVQNSIDASVDSTDSRKVISISARALDDGFIELAVADCGEGIPDSELRRIFEPFQTTKPEGLGMGLAISKVIVEQHGGRILASNNSDGGATIRFTLRQSAA